MKKIICFALFAGLVGSRAFAASPSIAAFAQSPHLIDPTISPDGRYLAVIATIDGKSVALTRDLQADAPFTPVIVVPLAANSRLTNCDWGNATRLVCNSGGASTVGDKPNTLLSSNLMAVDADGKNFKDLSVGGTKQKRISVYGVLDWTLDDPQTVLADTSYGIYKLDIFTGELTKYAETTADISSYYSDGYGNIRLGTRSARATVTHYARLAGEKSWRQLSKIAGLWREEEIVPVAVVHNTNKAYAIAAHNGHDAFYEIDLEDKRPPQLIFEHPLADVNQPMYFNAELVGVMYDLDRPFAYYLNEQVGAIIDSINKVLPNAFNRITSATLDRKKLVITSRSDVDAQSYYLYDVTDHRLTALGKMYPDLHDEDLARMRAVEYPTQDGAHVPGYLIIPPSQRAEKLPLIVMPHDRYQLRFTWAFDWYGQFLASRGYAVLLVNHRGSYGYGVDWAKAAKLDWGGLPYSDTTDGARWAVAQGIADPKRICILGEGWAGYTALLGGVRNSDFYKCAVSINGHSDMSEFEQRVRNTIRVKTKEQTADLVDPSKLKGDSIINSVEKIDIPILLIHATLAVADAPLKQSVDLDAALTKAGKVHKLVKLDGADERFWRDSERMSVLKELDEFFSAQLSKTPVKE